MLSSDFFHVKVLRSPDLIYKWSTERWTKSTEYLDVVRYGLLR
jgi:hypothetical protein